MEARPTPAASAAQRRSRRQARLRDASRLIPFFGIALLMLPDLVLSNSEAAEGATRPWLVYLFVAWGVLIAAGAWIAALHRRDGS